MILLNRKRCHIIRIRFKCKTVKGLVQTRMTEVTLLKTLNNKIALIYQLQEFPSIFPLRTCTSHSTYLRFYSSSAPITYKFECDEREPIYCSLIQHLKTLTSINTFKREIVEFIAMNDTELTLKMYPAFTTNRNAVWEATCDFTSLTLAQKFYKLITRDQPSYLVCAYTQFKLSCGDKLKIILLT